MIKVISFIVFFSISTISFAQRISGIVIDSLNLDRLPGASIVNSLTKVATATDSKGHFEIKVNTRANITVSFVGYSTFNKDFTITTDTTIVIKMHLSNTSLQEVSVQGNGMSNSASAQPLTTLNQIKITKIPTMLGESDVIKMLATTPGVKQVEGQQGFNVRGSSQDQNLVLYDEAIIYNCTHILGMYSVFNTNAVQNVLFYKSGIPSRFGGRLASAMIIEGNGGKMDHWENHISIGLLASNISFSGPIIKDKVSFSLSGRKSYLDKIILPLVHTYVDPSVSSYNNGYFFQDFNAKLVAKLNSNNKVEVSGYMGQDAFKLQNQKNEFSNNLRWGNTAVSLKWRHSFSDKLSCSNSLAYSNNFLSYNVAQYMYNMDLKTSISTIRYKSDWLLVTKDNPLRFGVEILKNAYNPNNINATVKEFALDFGKKTSLQAIEAAAFVEYPCNLGTKFSIIPGLRYSCFAQIGPYTKYSQDLLGQTTDSTLYASNKLVKSYSNPEPRIIATYTIDENTSIKSSATYLVQYNHLVPLITSALPTDMWLPSMNGVKPQKALQFSSGYYKSKNEYTFSVDAYFKRMNNVSEAANTLVNFYNAGNINDVVAQGKGYAYGIEFAYEKLVGKFTYSLSYTFSRSMRMFEMFNNGKVFPSKYDKPHDLTAIGSYPISKKWTLSMLFTYSSGVNLTMPIARYFVQNNVINYYGSKNGYRLPAYHRADVSAKYLIVDKPKIKSDITFSISNVYNHLNPYYMYYNVTGSLQQYKLEVQLEKVYLFPILPSITYNLTF
jgi:hypothetical protein